MVKDIYDHEVLRLFSDGNRSLFYVVWKLNLPIKIVIWLLWKNKLLTWENLGKRGFFGLGRC